MTSIQHPIYNWLDIASDFSDSILLGNGASISIDKCFKYNSLKDHAISNGLFTPDVEQLFKFFDTDDFELILRLVWQANKVNQAVNITDQKTKQVYEHVRDCLIQAVRSIHPAYSDVEYQFFDIINFLRRFKTVLSLNYDLTLYWVLMYSNSIRDGHYFKDCIIYREFDMDWQRFRDSLGVWDRETTLVFYPHGNLVLARDIIEQEFKLETSWGGDLLTTILTAWGSSDVIPLFVSEGTEWQKIAAIKNSHYLNTVYREVIPSIGDNLTIFGWGFGEHDIHILKRIRESKVTKIAVSVFNNNQAYCNRVSQMIHQYINNRVEIVFFDSQSAGCWNVPNP